MRRVLGATVVLALLLLGIPAAGQVAENTCNDVGFTSLTSSTSGVWGSIDFDDTSPTLTLEVNEGYEVNLCVKAGSINQGDGPEVSGPYGEGTHVVAHSSDKELSHYGFSFNELSTTTQPTTSSTSSTTTTTTTTTLSTTTTLVEVNPICIDCNNATVADLMQLVGVNETLALAIIANRPYERLQDLVTKGVMTGAQLLLILVINQDTGAFASDACLSFQAPAPTTTTLPGESTTTVPGDTTTTPGTLTIPTVPSTSVFGSAPRTPSPGDGELPFTGIEDWLFRLAAGLVLLGIPLVVTMRKEET